MKKASGKAKRGIHRGSALTRRNIAIKDWESAAKRSRTESNSNNPRNSQ